MKDLVSEPMMKGVGSGLLTARAGLSKAAQVYDLVSLYDGEGHARDIQSIFLPFDMSVDLFEGIALGSSVLDRVRRPGPKANSARASAAPAAIGVKVSFLMFIAPELPACQAPGGLALLCLWLELCLSSRSPSCAALSIGLIKIAQRSHWRISPARAE